MSTHPNVILALQLIPNDLPMKTIRQIVDDFGDKEKLSEKIIIDSDGYHYKVMEGDYNEDWQLSAQEGSIVLFDLVTYGYGDTITWEDLVKKEQSLRGWIEKEKENYHIAEYKIFVTANYW